MVAPSLLAAFDEYAIQMISTIHPKCVGALFGTRMNIL